MSTFAAMANGFTDSPTDNAMEKDLAWKQKEMSAFSAMASGSIDEAFSRPANNAMEEGTKDGTAMLVMRNFGFLGLHSSIHFQSKLACDRLVDITGDAQVRRQCQGEESNDIDEEGDRIYYV